MQTTELSVQGMSCSGCVASVTRAVKAVPGVQDAVVTLNPALARITFDPARVDVGAVVKAIEDAGYEVPRT